jgi:hypothetical protein
MVRIVNCQNWNKLYPDLRWSVEDKHRPGRACRSYEDFWPPPKSPSQGGGLVSVGDSIKGTNMFLRRLLKF